MQTRHILGAAGGAAGAILSTCGLIALSASALTNEIILSLFFPMYVFLGVNSYYDNKQEKLFLQTQYEEAQSELTNITLNYFLMILKEYMFRKNIKRVDNLELVVNFVARHFSAENHLFADNIRSYFVALGNDASTITRLIVCFQCNLSDCIITINDDFAVAPSLRMGLQSHAILNAALRAEMSVFSYVENPPPVASGRFNTIRRAISNFLNGYGCFAGPCAGTFGVINTVANVSLLAVYSFLMPLIITLASFCGIAVIVSGQKSFEKKMRVKQLAEHYQTLRNNIEHTLHDYEKQLEREIGFRQGLLQSQRMEPSAKSYSWRQLLPQTFHSLFNKIPIPRILQRQQLMSVPEEKNIRSSYSPL